MPWPVHPTGFFGARGDQDAYRIERSLRFNSADSAYLSRTPASAGNRKTWTWSGWVKLGNLGTTRFIFGANSGGTAIRTGASADTIGIDWDGGTSLRSTQVLRDVSSWGHLVVSVDTTQATASNRIRVYWNGSEITSWATDNRATTPLQNSDGDVNNSSAHIIGSTGAGSYYDGYLTEINFIDGQALTPSSFGETDAITGRWKAKAYSGTYGTNGFYLKFSDNSSLTTTSNVGIGKDFSGNGNYWATNGLSITAGAGNDSLLDSPTNSGTSGNYCTLNPLDKLLSPTLVNGNLEATVGDNAEIRVAIYVSFGKWYWEVVPTTMTYSMIGVGVGGATKHWETTGISYYGFNGNKYVNGTASAYGASYTNNDVIGVALDLDNLQITFYKNNVSQGTITGLTAGSYTPALSAAGNSSVYVANFGQRPFAYTAPAGFLSLCTTNLNKDTAITTSGSFTGNASADGPFVWLNGTPTAMTINGNFVTFGTDADKLAGGFKVRSSSASYNASGSNTFSVSTTERKFKYARAQAN